MHSYGVDVENRALEVGMLSLQYGIDMQAISRKDGP